MTTTPTTLYAVLVTAPEDGYRSTLCTSLDAEAEPGAFAFYIDEEEARRQAALFQDQFPEADYRVVEVVLRERLLRAGDRVRVINRESDYLPAYLDGAIVVSPSHTTAGGNEVVIVEDTDGDINAYETSRYRIERL